MPPAADSNVREVADFLVRFCDEHGDVITNLRLQKYLYYAQGWFLAFYDRPLFDEDLQAWVYGPVHPETYRRFKHHSFQPVTGDDVGSSELPDIVQDHLVEVHSAYGKFSAWDLERMTHAEDPWREARGDLPEDEPSTAVISQESMRRYFRGRLETQQ